MRTIEPSSARATLSNESKYRGERIVQYRFGDPREVLRIEKTIAEPPLSEGEVLVRVVRSVIHPGDLQLVAAKYSQPPPAIAQGRVPGLEAAGIVENGSSATLERTGLAIGMRVAFFAPGAWQTRTIVPAESLIGIPDDLPDSIATQVLVNTITARQVLRTGLEGYSVSPNRILQTGASSAVGKLITAFALRNGLEPIRLVRSSDSAERLSRILPGGHVIDMSAKGWRSAVRSIAEGDVFLALDGVGGPLVGEIGALLSVKGRMVSYGMLAGAPADLTLFAPKALSLIGVTIGTWSADAAPDVRAQDLQAAMEIGRAAPNIFAGHREFELSELSDAITAVTAPDKRGNVILKF